MEENGKKYMAYTREGADVALDLTVPRYNWLSGGVSYYHWKGKYGQVDDKGLRHHLGFDFSRLFGGGDFWGGLSFEVEYDRPRNGKTDWGGRVAYSYRFGDSSPTGESPAADTFDPRAHFFDRARREYAQRISRAEVPSGPSGPVGEQVSVYLVGGTGSAFVRYSATEIALSPGGVTAAIYPLLATATVWTAADSALDMGYQNLTSNIGWTVRLEAETTVDVNAGTALSLRQGGISIEQVGGIHLATSPSVAVNFAAGRQRVRMVHPYVQTVTQTQTRVTFQEGIVSVDVAGTLASHIYELIVHTTKVTAEIVSEGGRIRVPPVVQATMVSVDVAAGERASYTLPVANGERFSHRYDGDRGYPSGWMVSSDGVVSSSSSITEVTVITVSARSKSIKYRDSGGSITLTPISGTWVVSFVTVSVEISVPAGAVYVVPSYEGAVRTVSATGDPGHSFSLPGGPTGFSIDASGVIAVGAGSALRVGETVLLTVAVTGGLRSSDSGVVTIVGVAGLSSSTTPNDSYTVRLGETPTLFTLAVSGGDGNYSYSADAPLSAEGGTVAVRDAQTAVGRVSSVVSVSDRALGSAPLRMTFDVRFYSPVGYSPSEVRREVAFGVANRSLYEGTPAGGSGARLRFTLVSATPSSLTVSVGANGAVVLETPFPADSGLTLTAVVRATDEGTDESALLTLFVNGADRPAILSPRLYYAPENVSVSLTLTIAGGAPPYTTQENPAVDNFALENISVAVFSGEARGQHDLGIRIVDSQPVTVYATIAVSVYAPLGFSVTSSLRVVEDYIGVLQTIRVTGGFGAIDFETTTPGAAVGASDGIVSLTTPLSGTDRVVTVVARFGRSSSATHTLHLRSVAPLTFAPLPTMYIPTFSSPELNNKQFTLVATGGDGESPVTYDTEQTKACCAILYTGEMSIVITPDDPTLIVVTVRATQEGVIGGVATAPMTLWAFDHLAVPASPVSVTISGKEPGVVDGFRIEPTGGSSLYVYTVRGVTDSLGRDLGVTIDAEGRLGMAVSLSTTTITVDVGVSDAIVSPPAALTMSNVYVETPHQDLRIVLEGDGVSRLRLSGLRDYYYVSSGRLTTDTSSNRVEDSFVPYALVTLTATGGSDGAYEWGEETGTNSEGLLELVAGSVNVATVSVVQHFIPPWDPSAGGVPSNLTLGLREWAVTVGGGGDLGATATLSVEFYAPISIIALSPVSPLQHLVVPAGFVGTLSLVGYGAPGAVAYFFYGTDSDWQLDYEATVISGDGRYADYFAPDFFVSVYPVDPLRVSGRTWSLQPVVTATVARDFVAVVSMTVTDGVTGEKSSVAITIGGESFSQTRPFPAVALAPNTACSGSSCEVIDDLDSFYTGGTPPYSYSVIFDAAGGNANFGVSGRQLLFTGDARASGEVITATVVAVGSGVTVQSPITVFFSTAPSFFPTHVARSVEAGYTGAVYLPMVEDGTGPFVYSVVAPTFISGGGRTVSVSGGGAGDFA